MVVGGHRVRDRRSRTGGTVGPARAARPWRRATAKRRLYSDPYFCKQYSKPPRAPPTAPRALFRDLPRRARTARRLYSDPFCGQQYSETGPC